MTHFVRHVTSRNPVWIVPLALPIVLYASTSVERAVLFAAAVVVTVPLSHAVSFFVERWLPRYLRMVPLLVVAAVVVTVFELLVLSFGYPLSDRSRYLLQALTVTGITVWPTGAAPLDESWPERLSVATGLAAGFLVGFVPIAAVRIVLSRVGYGYADALFVGFLLLAIGRAALNAYRMVRGAGE